MDFLLQCRDPIELSQPHQSFLEAFAQEVGASSDQVPRPEAHLRYSSLDQRGSSQGSPRVAGALLHSNHPGHLLPRTTEHAGEAVKAMEHVVGDRWSS